MTTTLDNRSWLSAAASDRIAGLVHRLATGLPRYRSLVLAVVLVWGLGDVVSTLFAAHATGSTAMESNPLIRALLAIDPLLVVLLKAAVVTVVAIVLFESRSLVERVPGHRLCFVGWVGIGLLVTANNLAIGLAALA